MDLIFVGRRFGTKASLFICSQMREFARSLKRPFQLRYNPYTQSIEILDSKEKLIKLASEVQENAALLGEALKTVHL